MHTPSSAGHGVVELGRAEALRLLAGHSMGRIAFTTKALPDIRLAGHQVADDGRILVDVGRPIGMSRTGGPVVVAYEVDDIDLERGSGWSVVVVGLARTATADVADAGPRLRVWGDPGDAVVVEIEPSIVTGMRLVGIDAAGLPYTEPRPTFE